MATSGYLWVSGKSAGTAVEFRALSQTVVLPGVILIRVNYGKVGAT